MIIFEQSSEGDLAFAGVRSGPSARSTAPRILLVEDNEMNRDMLSRRLMRKGYSVTMAEDGSQGLEMAASMNPDLILLDMSLPEIDGWEVARQLKANENLRRIPIIALTAHAMSDDRSRAIEAGCDEYDTKPVEFSRLIQKMELLLNSPRGKSSPNDTNDPEAHDDRHADRHPGANAVRGQ
jgi:CheY-like chemotaxis protein